MGSIAYFAGQSSAPAGWVLCDGSAVSRTTYATLFSAVGTTYGSGDGSTTFALPDLIDKFVEGSSTAGTIKTAGLPNITGNSQTSLAVWNVSSVQGDTLESGALKGVVTGNKWNQGSNGTRNFATYYFNASKSNSIYGNSTTVQPPALTMKPFIYTGKTSVYKWLRTA